jgi:hypothetical protein
MVGALLKMRPAIKGFSSLATLLKASLNQQKQEDLLLLLSPFTTTVDHT